MEVNSEEKVSLEVTLGWDRSNDLVDNDVNLKQQWEEHTNKIVGQHFSLSAWPIKEKDFHRQNDLGDDQEPNSFEVEKLHRCVQKE